MFQKIKYRIRLKIVKSPAFPTGLLEERLMERQLGVTRPGKNCTGPSLGLRQVQDKWPKKCLPSLSLTPYSGA
jgi:hypothetical protein